MSLKIRCPEHPRYDGEADPRASCEPCLWLWKTRLNAEQARLEIVMDSLRWRRGFDEVAKDKEATLTPGQVAQRLGVSLPFVYYQLWAGKLPGQKVGKSWRIPLSVVEQYERQRETWNARRPSPPDNPAC